MGIPPELVQPIWQGFPSALGKYLQNVCLLEQKGGFQQDEGYCNSKVGLGSVLGLSPTRHTPNWG